MRTLHVIGGKNHGKTTLIVELVRELSRRGFVVGTIKHTHHQHELDVPGKDSYRHRMAGSKVVGIVSPSLHAVFVPADGGELSGADYYAEVAPLYAKCHLILVEGDSYAIAPKLEVWRSELGTPPLVAENKSILAVISDDRPAVPAFVLPRSDVTRVADWICREFLGESAG